MLIGVLFPKKKINWSAKSLHDDEKGKAFDHFFVLATATMMHIIILPAGFTSLHFQTKEL